MTDVLLTHSYFLQFDPKQFRAMMPYPPLGTLYAASVLRKSGRSVRLFDTMLESSEESIREQIIRWRPSIVAIYDDDFHYLTKMCLTRMRRAACSMTAIAKEFSLPVIVHGSDAADHAEEYLAAGADAVIRGEGEVTLNEVCSTLLAKDRNSLSSIAGIVFRHDGETVRTVQRSVQHDLDALPFPAWDLIDGERYRTAWKRRHGYFSINMVTTRGCPYHCNWCAKPIYGQVYNSRSPEHVVEEMKILRQTVRPDHIWFADDIFGLKPGWVDRFAEEVRKNDVRIPFMIQSRADLLLKGTTVRSLADAGCTEVWIGAESGSQKVLDAMEKGITVEQIAEARALLRRHGIRASFFLQFGYRGEMMEDIQATITMVKRLMPDDIGISVSYPLPGTKFYASVVHELGEKRNWTDSDDLAMMYRAEFSPAFYRRLHRYVHRTFRIAQAAGSVRNFFSRTAISRREIRRIVLLPYYTAALVFDFLTLQLIARFR